MTPAVGLATGLHFQHNQAFGERRMGELEGAEMLTPASAAHSEESLEVPYSEKGKAVGEACHG